MTSNADSPAGFFQVDRRIWANVTAVGMNQAAAFLVLACGTGRSNRTTAWSTKAVMTHAGLGWKRAKAAIEDLIGTGFIRRTENYTPEKPRYELATYRELVDYEFARNLSALMPIEQAVLADIQNGIQPMQRSSSSYAARLRARGLLARDAEGFYKLPGPMADASVEDLIWLPNAIVTGTSCGEESPLQRLRSTGCTWTLRLFVDLYSAQNLRDDGGINPGLIRRKYGRREIGQQGAYIVWGFKLVERCVWWDGVFAAHYNRSKASEHHAIWKSLDLLTTMGLLSYVPHILENDTQTAEPVHVYGIGELGEIPMEQEIGEAADRAAREICLPSKVDAAEAEGFRHFCPVLKTKPFAQMVGVARLTYRPHTKRTGAWIAELHQNAPKWVKLFDELLVKAEMATAARDANFA